MLTEFSVMLSAPGGTVINLQCCSCLGTCGQSARVRKTRNVMVSVQYSNTKQRIYLKEGSSVLDSCVEKFLEVHNLYLYPVYTQCFISWSSCFASVMSNFRHLVLFFFFFSFLMYFAVYTHQLSRISCGNSLVPVVSSPF